MLYDISVDGKNYRLELSQAEGRWMCKLNGQEIELDPVLVGKDTISLIAHDHSYEIRREQTGGEARIWIDGTPYAVELRDPKSFRARRRIADHNGPKKLIALMPGKVVRLLLSAGNEVEAGQGVVVLEAMKMQNEIKSPKKGVVHKLLVEEGTAVKAGDVLAIVE
jgi:biotin carboxyl carrier protein